MSKQGTLPEPAFSFANLLATDSLTDVDVNPLNLNSYLSVMNFLYWLTTDLYRLTPLNSLIYYVSIYVYMCSS